MSFWNGFKQALGFSHDSEEDEEDYSSALPTYAVTPPPTPVNTTPVSPVSEKPESGAVGDPNDNTDKETPDSLPADIFDAVIKVFNEAQPDFVKNCLSVEAQRIYLTNCISDSLRKRIAERTSGVSDEAIRHKTVQLEAETKRTERLSAENNKLRLSLDRQKRAMLDRINDLEAQVAKLHSDKEKYYIDRHNPADKEAIAKSSEQIASLEAEVATLKEKLDNESAEGSRQKVAELEKELDRQSTLREQLELKSRMSDEMLTELRNNMAKTRHELEQVTAEREEATKLIAEQLDGFEKLKERLEARIKDLQQRLEDENREDREQQIAKLNEENASLRHTIENNLYNQANSEMRLRKEIKTLTARIKELEQETSDTAETTADEMSATQSDTETSATAPRRRGRPRKIKADSDLDNTDWFAGGKKDDPDFGYHEPPRRPANDNEAQLSLF